MRRLSCAKIVILATIWIILDLTVGYAFSGRLIYRPFQVERIASTSTYDAFGQLFPIGNYSLYVYREGYSHASDRGKIFFRTSSDSGATWSDSNLLIEDPIYDCRNVHGGAISTSEVIVFFNKYDFIKAQSVGVFFMHGTLTEDAIEWSQAIPINDRSIPYGDILRLQDGRLMQCISKEIRTYNTLKFETYLHFSEDNGWTWGSFVKVDGPLVDGDTPDEEISFIETKEGYFLGIGRNNSYGALLLYLSIDQGQSWSVNETNLQIADWNFVSPYAIVVSLDSQYLHLFYAARYKDGKLGRIYSVISKITDVTSNPKSFSVPQYIYEANTSDLGYPSALNQGSYVYGIFYSGEGQLPPNLFMFAGNYGYLHDLNPIWNIFR